MHHVLLALLFFADPQSAHPGWCEANRQTSHELKKLAEPLPLDLDLHLAYQHEAGRKSQTEQIGFGDADKWRDEMLAKLNAPTARSEQ